MAWEIFIFRSERKQKPVEEFILSLEAKTRAKVSHHKQLLETYGPLLSMPYAKKLTDKVYELRVRGKEEVRILYSFVNKKVWFLHGFKKKTRKTPSKEIKIAEKRFRALTSP